MEPAGNRPRIGRSDLDYVKMPCQWKLLFEDVTRLPERMQEKKVMPVWLLKHYGREFPFAADAHFRVVLYESELLGPEPSILKVERVEGSGETVVELLDKYKPIQFIG